MLSRVACNLYWTARYLERAEDTARMIGVNANLLMDLPRNTPFGWEPLVFISGGEATFAEHYEEASEQNVVRFLISDRINPSSVLSSLAAARENLRTTRDIVQREAWEQVNDLYLYVKDHLAAGMSRRSRQEFLRRVIQSSQQLTGMMADTMSHTHAYDFIKLGRSVERADMTTRILDVRSANLLPGSGGGELSPFDNIQWMSVLRSLSAYQMYRQHVRLRVRGPDVVRFLLQDRYFPRSVHHCLGEMSWHLGHLPSADIPQGEVAELTDAVTTADVAALSLDGLHLFIDDIQVGLGDIHGALDKTYFAPQE